MKDPDQMLDKIQAISLKGILAIGGLFLTSLISTITVWDWMVEQWKANPLSFVGGMLAAALLGGLVACAICISLFRFAYGRKTGEKTGHPIPDETMDAFRKICGTCYYDENLNAIEPLIFSLDDEKLSVLGLSVRDVKLAREATLIELVPSGIQPSKRAFKGEVPGVSFVPDDRYCGEYSMKLRFEIGNKLTRTPTLEKDRKPYDCIDLGIVRFTIKGRDLAHAIKPYRQENLFAYVDDRYYEVLGAITPEAYNRQ